ncbi:O-antigen ligase family protein [Ferruginibacter sp. SUN106]|uniref:O-antigen ligase family protein n=1 Tax=Ferruginibacter sp. SUN106 TaxID=2978348 RepID=UPI003D35E664
MKSLFIIDDNMANKISYYHLACFCIALPFDFFYSQLVLISFALHTLIHLKQSRFRLFADKNTLIPITIFLLGLLTIFYSSDKTEGLNIAGRQSAIFIIPVLLALNPLDLSTYKLPLLKIFALTCTAVILYLYADAVHTLVYFHLPLSTLFTTAFINHNFSLPVAMHATYLSMYAAFALLTFLYVIIKESSRNEKIFFSFCSCLLFSGIVQLTSRAVFGGMLLIIPVGVSFFLLNGKKRIVFLSISGVIAVTSFFIITKIDAFKTRYVSELKNDLTQTAINNEILEPRVARWQLAFDLVKKSPVIGYGAGSEKELLKQKYFDNKLYISYLEEFNEHSQYLSFLLRAGVIGLCLYLFVLYYGFSVAVKNKDFLFFSFMALIATVSVSENILDLNKGIFFYSFFFSFFLTGNQPQIFYRGNQATF